MDSSSLVTSHASENVMNVEERVRRVKKESENNFQIDIIYNRLDDLVHLVLELLQFNELNTDPYMCGVTKQFVIFNTNNIIAC